MQVFLCEYTPGAPTAKLPLDEARHAMKVLRHSIGDRLHCVDGQGHKLTTRIASGNEKRVELEVLSVESNWHEPAHPRVLLFAPPKARDRLEWLLQKATELGATHLLPVETARTERTRIKQDRAEG
ncbi:MAG: RsmE family RNA methyltransferase, partial [Bacteroidota bacterium]